MRVYPCNRRFLIKPLVEEEDKNQILVPEDYKPKQLHGLAMILGKSKDATIDAKLGETIVYEQNMVEEVSIKGETNYLLLENYILCVLEEQEFMDLNELRKLIAETVKERQVLLAQPVLNEGSFSRAKSHIEDKGTPFVMISAYRGGKGTPGNRQRHKEMKSAFKTAGFPFVEMIGGYSEDEFGDVTEPSLLVLDQVRPDVAKEAPLFDVAQALAKRYEQDSFIYGAPAQTSDGQVASKQDPLFGGIKPMMDIRAYDSSGQVINAPWAGPWTSLTTAKEDDIYWSVVGGKKGKLAESLNKYKKMIPLKRQDAMIKDHYLKSAQGGLDFLETKRKA